MEPQGRGFTPTTAGLPQGIPLSPLLANFYLTPFDRKWRQRLGGHPLRR
jgi:retron-type reverse transcriptase